MDRAEWLKSLKTGDKVANKVNVYGKEHYYKFYEVKKVTPKGQIRLTNEILLNEDGHYHKYDRHGCVNYDIEPITQDILNYEANRKKKTSLYLEVSDLLEKSSKECSNWSIEKLEKVKRFLKDGEVNDNE